MFAVFYSQHLSWQVECSLEKMCGKIQYWFRSNAGDIGADTGTLSKKLFESKVQLHKCLISLSWFVYVGFKLRFGPDGLQNGNITICFAIHCKKKDFLKLQLKQILLVFTRKCYFNLSTQKITCNWMLNLLWNLLEISEIICFFFKQNKLYNDGRFELECYFLTTWIFFINIGSGQVVTCFKCKYNIYNNYYNFHWPVVLLFEVLATLRYTQTD